MKLLVLFILVGTSSACLAQQAAVDSIMGTYEDSAISEINDFCSEKWPSDFVLRKYCIDEARKDRDEAQRLDLMADNNNMIIWGTCLDRWQDNAGRTDWTMANYCIKKQLEALE